MVISTSREGTLTAICALDQREARDVRASLRLAVRETIVLASEHDVFLLYGTGMQVRVVETRRFNERHDAARILDKIAETLPGIVFERWPRAGRLMAEQHGGAGLRGLDAIAAAAAPKGTRPHYYVPRLVSGGIYEDKPVWERVKEEMAFAVGEPHLLLTLTADDYGPADKLPAESEYFERGWLALYAVALRADNPDYVVIRPGEYLAEGWLPDDFDGRWMTRPTTSRTIQMARAGTALRFPPSWLYATPTGRIEVRDDDAIAEVWEVTG